MFVGKKLYSATWSDNADALSSHTEADQPTELDFVDLSTICMFFII